MSRNTTNYVISGTLSFRLGSRKILKKWGGNLQNIEKSMRRIYVPDPGKVFVQVDQSGAEALIVAYLCEPGNYRDLFIHNVKPHVFVGLHNFKQQWKDYYAATGVSNPPDIDTLCSLSIPELKKHRDFKEVDKLIKSSDSWPAEKRYYYIAKMICHGCNYGMRAGAFQLNVLEKSRGKIALTKKQVEKYLTTYHGLFPEIHGWHRDVERQITETHYLFNLFGFPRYFFFAQQNPSDNLLKEAYAQVPQSTVGCITHIAFTRMYNFICENNLSWDLLANTHDSYLLQCPIGDERVCGIKGQELINQELVSPRGERFRMKSEAQYGYNWAPQSAKNVDGLREF